MRSIRSVVLLLSMLPAAAVMPTASTAQILGIGVSITIAPPELPVYEQPPLPAPGYMWTPGYWSYGPDGYFWVPGTWVEPPSVGVLWTPGYWGWRDGAYAWSDGYWGPHIGFYGGVNYGFGYGGVGYEGGYWNNGAFAYNRTVNNFGGVSVTNVYSKTVIVNSTTINRTSFNGGTGGTTAQPTAQELAAHREQHVAATPAQAQHMQMASTNKALLASENKGHPLIAGTSKPGEFTGKGVVGSHDLRGATTTTLGTKSNATSNTMQGATQQGTKSNALTGTNAATGNLDKKGSANKLPTGTTTTDHKAVGGTQEHATINSATTPKTLNTPPSNATPQLRGATQNPGGGAQHPPGGQPAGTQRTPGGPVAAGMQHPPAGHPAATGGKPPPAKPGTPPAKPPG